MATEDAAIIVEEGKAETGTPDKAADKAASTDPAAAIAAAARKAEEADAAARREREGRLRAEREAAETKRTASTTLLTEREQAVVRGLDAAKSARTTAMAALKAAREQGDLDAEMEAQEALDNARADIRQYEGAKRQLETAKTGTGAGDGRAPQQPQRSTEAQRWLDDHPLFESDPEYRADAIASHSLALEQGHAEGSRAYVDFIEARMTRLYGEGHGKTAASRRAAEDLPATRNGNGGRAAATGLRPNGGAGASSGGMPGEREVRTAFGPVHVKEGEDGKPRIRLSPQIRQEWEQAARWANMSLAEYAQEQIAIADEQAQGGTAGLIRDDNSRVYR